MKLKPVREVVTEGSEYKDYEVEDLITQDRQHTKEVLMGRVSEEKFEWLSPEEMKEHEGCRYHKNGLYVGQVAGDNYNKAIDQALQIIEETFKSE